MYYFHYRTFTDPSPPEREVLNAVSSLSSNIICSLKLGLIRPFSFNGFVRRDVFNFLFSNSDNRVFRKRGKMYNRCDFSDKYSKIVILCTPIIIMKVSVLFFLFVCLNLFS